MPRTLGDSFVHVSKIDFGVEVDQPPYDHNPGEIGDVERKIGEFVADLVQDEATLQMGIGAIPSAVGQCLYDKKNLGVHTEMFTDVLVDLVERGVVTCERKDIDCGKIVTAFMMGTQRLYKFVDNNPMVEMRPVDYTNDTSTSASTAHDGDQLGHRGRSDRPGLRRLDRPPHVQRRRRPDGLHARRGPGRGGPGDHRPAVHRGRRQVLAHHDGLKEGAGVTTTRSHVRTS
jgi:hypothetical protein